MKPFAILRVAKLKKIGNVRASGQHTWRERETQNADESMTPANKTIGAAGSAALVDAVKKRVAQATEKISADSVPCIEILATASPEWWKHASRQNLSDFFERAGAWIQKKFGRENVVSMVAHLDETSPHLVAYVVPLLEVEGKSRKRSVIVGTNPDGSKKRETREFQTVAGRRLSAAHWLDGRDKLSDMQTEFAAEMQPLGLHRGIEKSRARHQTIKSYYARVNAPGRPLPEVQTPAPKPMPPEPPRPGLLASKETRERWEAWQQEAARRERQKRQHLAEKAKLGAVALEQVRELEPKARELEQVKAERDRLQSHADGLRSRAQGFEIRAAHAEAVAQLFTPAEIEQRKLQRQQEVEAAKRAEREAVRRRELQFIEQRRESVQKAEQQCQDAERLARGVSLKRLSNSECSGPGGP